MNLCHFTTAMLFFYFMLKKTRKNTVSMCTFMHFRHVCTREYRLRFHLGNQSIVFYIDQDRISAAPLIRQDQLCR